MLWFWVLREHRNGKGAAPGFGALTGYWGRGLGHNNHYCTEDKISAEVTEAQAAVGRSTNGREKQGTEECVPKRVSEFQVWGILSDKKDVSGSVLTLRGQGD